MNTGRNNVLAWRRSRWPIAAAVWALCHGVSIAEPAAQPLQPDAYFRADRAYRAIDALSLIHISEPTRRRH